MNILLRLTASFAAGIWLSSFLLHRLDSPLILSVAAALGFLIFLLIGFRKSNRYLLGSLTMLLFMALGWLRTSLLETCGDFSQVVAYQAVVLTPPETRAKTYKVEVAVLKAKHGNKWHPFQGKVLLYVDKAAPKPRYGDVLLIRGTPRLVEPPQNPAQFDYQKFLANKQLFYQHYLKTTDFTLTGERQTNWLKNWAYKASEWSDAALRRLVIPDREYAVAKAMVLGVRDEMDNDLVQAYSAAGAVHVLSVSGFHITIFIGILTFFLGRLEKRRRGRWLYLGITLTTMWFYAVLTGLSAPVIRSALMFTIFLLAKPLGRKENSVNALFSSALILLAIDPLLLYSVSFQLSYAALGGIIFLQPILYQSLTFKDWFLDKIWAITAVALTAQLATFPLGVYYFHQFPNYFWLVNPLVVALSCAMLPVAFAAIAFSWVPILSDALGWALTGITWLLNQVVIFTEKLPYSVLGGLSFSWMELLLIYAIIGLLLGLLYYRNARWMWGLGTTSLGLLVLQVVEIKEFSNQKWLTIHAVPRQTVISLIDNQRAVLVADSAFFQPDQKPYNFYLKNFYTERSINHVTQEALEIPSEASGVVKSLPFGKLIVWQGHKILLVEKFISDVVPPVADYVLVRNTAFRKSEQIRAMFGNQPLIFDNSNKFYVLDTLQKQAIAEKLLWHL